jgi:hypothetical protein
MNPQTVTKEERLQDIIAGFYADPLGFVECVWDWGYGRLAEFAGPDTWQRDLLKDIGSQVLTSQEAVREAVTSGHGPGKTALVAWLIYWFISTRPHPQIVVTSNTKSQLETKTWRELAKWHKLAINSHWFEWTATKFYYKQHPETWFAAAIPWSKERSEAFAGTHEQHVLVIFDEASLVDDSIWETTEGAMTQPGAFWCVFGNPTRNTGRFSECFKKYRHRWHTYQVDSRTAKMANKNQIQQWIDDYGEDSDFVRIRVKGEFPRASSNQLIAGDVVDLAASRKIGDDLIRHAPLVLGVDVARFGDDQSVLVYRQGLQAFGIKKYRSLDTMKLSGLVSLEIQQKKPSAVLVDEVGIGAGVVDRLNQLGFGDIVYPVNNARTAINDKEYYNLRAESWAKMGDWLKMGSIPDDRELKDDLTGVEYGFDAKNRIQLEKKEDMKSRGLASPDCADALAMTFAVDVGISKWRGQTVQQARSDYDVLNYSQGAN